MTQSKQPVQTPPMRDPNASVIVIGTITIEVAVGELAKQSDVEALVVVVNPSLAPVGSAAHKVHERAGAQFAAHCRSLAPARPGDTIVITGAFSLPNKTVLHCREPISRRHPMYVDDLAFRYGQMLQISDEQAIRSLALEPLGGGVRLEDVWSEAGIVVERVQRVADSLQHLRTVRFVLSEESEAQRFRAEIMSYHNEKQTR